MSKSAKTDVGSMARSVSPQVETWLGRKIDCLDHGFIYLVDYMGGDAAIVQAARVSYGLGTKTVHEDRGLIRYLMRHEHTTPFEMVELKFHVKLPIFVARQWIRHRTACLSGDTRLIFDLPGASNRGRRQSHAMALGRLHRLWHNGTTHPIYKKKPLHLDRVTCDLRYTVPELARLVERREEDLRNLIRAGALSAEREAPASRRAPALYVRGVDWHEYAQRTYQAHVGMRGRLSRMRLRMCQEDNGEIRHTTVTDVWETGVRPVFRVILENGYTIKMTKDHRCLTEEGWMTLEQATNLRQGDVDAVTWDGSAPALAVNGVSACQDREWLAARRAEGLEVDEIANRAGVSYHTIRKYLRRFGLQYSAAERSVLSGRAQRDQRRTFKRPRIFTAEHLALIRAARSGANSNFWKGGMASERSNIARWTKEHAAAVHARHKFRCVICERGGRLHAHHLDPVWNNVERARDVENLVTLCQPCHSAIHRRNLELDLLDAFGLGRPLNGFLDRHAAKARPREKRTPTPRRLVRTFSRIARIEFAGHEMTYDVAVNGPCHNFVANGFIVHNSVNEYSGRYSVMTDESYLPGPEHVTEQSAGNRQGGADPVEPARAAEVIAMLEREQRLVREGYQKMLGWNVRRELARINLGLAQYTEWYWKSDLLNIFRFLNLRLDEHAQYEIRVYAEAMAKIVRAVVPVAWEAFEDYALRAVRFSRLEMDAIARLLRRGDAAWPEDRDVESAMPDVWKERNADGSVKRNRERDEFLSKLKRLASSR